MKTKLKVGDRVSWMTTKRRKYGNQPKRVGIILSIRWREPKMTAGRRLLWNASELARMGYDVAKVRDEDADLNWTVPLKMCTKVSGTKRKTVIKASKAADELKNKLREADYQWKQKQLTIADERGLENLKVGDPVFVQYSNRYGRTKETFSAFNARKGRVAIQNMWRPGKIRWLNASSCYASVK